MQLALLEVHMGDSQKNCLRFLCIDMHGLNLVYEPPPTVGSSGPMVAPHPQSEASVKRCWDEKGRCRDFPFHCLTTWIHSSTWDRALGSSTRWAFQWQPACTFRVWAIESVNSLSCGMAKSRDLTWPKILANFLLDREGLLATLVRA